ncbi:MAG TPA: DUF2480 family protein [Chitinophagaceae bacterium]|jgi:hypothetical protein
MQDTIVNKVAESGIITLNLEDYYPKEEIVVFDLKEHLFRGLILKEKDFREALRNINWQQYENKNVAITCTTDAIIPMWAYMLVASYLESVAANFSYGNEKDLITSILIKKIAAINGDNFADKRVVIKGCGDIQIPGVAYVEITNKLRPYAKSIMYGEACSTVPIYKKK